jgi:hypothetical protein
MFDLFPSCDVFVKCWLQGTAAAAATCDMEEMERLIGTDLVDVDDPHYPMSHHFGYSLLHLAAGSEASQAADVMALLVNAGAELDGRATKLDRRTALCLLLTMD